MIDFAYFLLGALPILIFITILAVIEAIADKKYTALIVCGVTLVIIVVFILLVL